MVTAPEAIALLTIASGFDNRKPDRDTARMWAEALADIDYDDARAVVVSHFQHSTEWLMPVHIINGVRKLETDRLAALPNLYELEPPERVTALIDDDEAFNAAYLDWIKEQGRRARRGLPLEVGPARIPGQRQLVS